MTPATSISIHSTPPVKMERSLGYLFDRRDFRRLIIGGEKLILVYHSKSNITLEQPYVKTGYRLKSS